MAQYTFSTADNQLIADIQEIKSKNPQASFSQTVELLLLQAVKERKRQRMKNAKKGNTKHSTGDMG